MSRQFEGKVALVTGGNSGIGKATAFAFAKEGANVAIAARREELGEMHRRTLRLVLIKVRSDPLQRVSARRTR